MKQHCPKCGNLLNPRSKYCPKCGTDVSEIIKENLADAKVPVKPASKPLFKKWWFILSLGLILLILILGVAGSKYYQKKAQLTRINAALVNPKSDLSKYVITDSKVEVSDANLKPLQKYFSQNQAIASQIIHNKINNPKFALTKKGHYFLIFPKYQLKVQAVKLLIKANPKTQVVINQQKYQQKASEQSVSLFPGEYLIKAKYQLNHRQVVKSKQLTLLTNQSVDLQVKTKDLVIKSLPKAAVYLDHQYVGKTNQKGIYKFNNYLVTNQSSLYLTKKINGKLVRSRSVKKFDSQVIQPIWPGSLTKKQIASFIEEVYRKNLASDYVNGKQNPDYLAIQKMKKQFSADPSIKSVQYRVSDIVINSKTKRIDYHLKYLIKRAGATKKQIVKYNNAEIISGKQLKMATIGSGKLISSVEK